MNNSLGLSMKMDVIKSGRRSTKFSQKDYSAMTKRETTKSEETKKRRSIKLRRNRRSKFSNKSQDSVMHFLFKCIV